MGSAVAEARGGAMVTFALYFHPSTDMTTLYNKAYFLSL